ncbi:hypothetical protein KA012_04905 [Candidatus Woesebacteria bacterium]|nr:hypothetical protein [Candidatus Woesebacteria bacterium]
MLARLRLRNFVPPSLKWFEQQQTSILSAATIITAANVLSALAAIVRQRLLTSLFFDTVAAQQALEAFLVSFQLPDMMFQLLVIGSVSAAFIPVFTTIKRVHDEKKAFALTDTLLTTLLVAFIVMSIVIAIYSYPITVWRTGAQYTEAQIRLTSDLTRMILIAQIFFLISSIHGALLQSYQRFIIPSLAPILYNLGIVAGAYFLTPVMGIYGPGLGACFGAFLHMAIQIPFSRKLGYKFKFSLNWKTPGFSSIIKLMPARTLTLAAGELQVLALTFFTTNIGNLSFLITRYALLLITLPIRFFGVPIGQASLPFLSEQSEDNERSTFRKLLIQSLNQIAFLAMPSSILIVILRIPLVRMLFGTQNFPWEATLSTGKMVGIIAISITAQAMVQLLIRAYFALKDTWTPLLLGLLDLGIFLIAVSVINLYFPSIALVGIAWAMTFAAFIEVIMMLWLLHRRIGDLLSSTLIIGQLKIIAASFLMAVFLYLPFRLFDLYLFNTSRTLELILLVVTTGTIGLLVYVYFANLLKIPELELLQKLFSTLKTHRAVISQTPEVVSQPPESQTL